MSSEFILLVCSANVCRSPLAELLLKQAFGEQHIRIESAGTHAVPGGEICPFVAELRSGTEWAREAGAHRARPVTVELLAEAELVLTAARDIRSEVVRLHPEVRDRAFTFREAVILGAGSVLIPNRRSGRISAYAEHLHQSRPKTVLPRPARRFWGLGQKEDPLSIVDRHGRRSGVHRGAIAESEQALSMIIQQITG